MTQKYYKESYEYDILELEKAEKLFKRLSLEEEWFKEPEDIEGKYALLQMGSEYFTRIEYLSILCYMAYKRSAGGVIAVDSRGKSRFYKPQYEDVCLLVVRGLMEKTYGFSYYTNLVVRENGELWVNPLNKIYSKDISNAYDSVFTDRGVIKNLDGEKWVLYKVPDYVNVPVSWVNKEIADSYDEWLGTTMMGEHVTSKIKINYV